MLDLEQKLDVILEIMSAKKNYFLLINKLTSAKFGSKPLRK